MDLGSVGRVRDCTGSGPLVTSRRLTDRSTGPDYQWTGAAGSQKTADAGASKLQAASDKLDWQLDLCYRIIKEKVMRESKYSFLYKAYDGSIMRPESFLNINKGRTLSSSQLRMLGITKIKNKSFKRQATSHKLDR